MSMSNDDKDLKAPVPTSAEIIRLLASDDDDEPLTGGTMEKVMKHIKASVCCIDIKEFILIAKQEHQQQQQHQKRKPRTSTSHNGSNAHYHTVPRSIPICDARSPGEFALGHIPGATNLPIFTNEERSIVGTMYNKTGRSTAMVKGMSIVRPKLGTLVTTAVSIVANANIRARAHTQSSTINEQNAGDEVESDETSNSNSNNVLLLHCWRGGMRSCSLAFLIQTQCPDLKVYVLTGGYKAFRKWQYSLYCYLPPNANYSEHHSELKGGGGASAHHHGTGKKRMSQKQKLKAALRKSTAKGIGATRRESDIAQADARNRELCGVGQAVKDNAARVEKDMEAAEAQRKAEWADAFDRGPRIVIVGGPTGSGKTKVLYALRDVMGEQIIDLEGLANHCGSAFGFVGHNEPQPTTQQYTNDIAMEWNSLDPDRPVFIEDEGHHVGKVSLPVGLYRKMRTASIVLKLDVPKEIRIIALREDYALPEKKNVEDDSCNDSIPTDKDISEWFSNMIEAIKSLERRVGQKRMNTMLEMLQNGRSEDFAREALEYYDGLYDKHIANEDGSADMKGNGSRAATISTISVDNMEKFDAVAVAQQVIATYNELI